MSDSRSVPTYDKNVALQVTQQPNPEGAASMMINAFRSFSEGVAAASQGISQEQATQQREIIKNNISTAYRGFALEALKNPDQNAGLAGYNESSRQYAKQLLQQTDHFNKPYVSNLVDYFHNEHQFSIEKNAILQNKRQIQVSTYDAIDNAVQDYSNGITNSVPVIDESGRNTQFDAPYALFTDTLRNLHDNAVTTGLSPEKYEEEKKKLTKDFYSQVALKEYEQHYEAGKGHEYIANIQKNGYQIPGLSSQDSLTLVGKMIGIENKTKASARSAYGELDNDIKFEMDRISKGGMPNAHTRDKVAALGSPELLQKYDDNVYSNQLVHSAKQATFYMSPSEIQKYKDHINSIDDTQWSNAKFETKANAIKAIDQQTQEFKLNPMRQMMEQPNIANIVNTYEQAFNAQAVGNNKQYTPVNSIVQKPWQAIIDGQMFKGLTLNGSAANRVRLLEQSQVPEKVNAVMTSDPKDAIGLINRWEEEYGGGLPFNLVMKQLIDNGLPKEYALLANVDPNSQDASDVVNSIRIGHKSLMSEVNAKNPGAGQHLSKQALNDVYNLDGSATSSAFASYMKTIPRNSAEFNRDFMDGLAGTIEQIAAYKMLAKGAQGTDAIKDAENIIANKYQYMTLKNKMISIPKNSTADAIASYADKMEAQVGIFPFNYSSKTAHVDETANLAGHWVNDQVDHGLVWVDSNGVMRVDKNGHPLTFSFDDAMGYTHSDVNFMQSIGTHQREMLKKAEENKQAVEAPQAAPDADQQRMDAAFKAQMQRVKTIVNNRNPRMTQAIEEGK